MTSSPPQDVPADVPTVARHRETVTELGRRALDADDLDRFLRDAATAIGGAVDTEYVSVFELSPGGDDASLRAGTGWRDGLVGTTLPATRETHVGRTVISGDTVTVHDGFGDAQLTADHDLVGGVSVVVGAVEDPWGVLGVYATDRREFTADEVAFLRNAADLLEAAIDDLSSSRRFPEATDRSTNARQDRITRALETTGEGISLLDEDGEFVYVNEAYAEIYGYEPTDLLGEHWALLYPDGEEEQIYEEVLPELAEAGTWSDETVGLRKDGSTFVEDHRLATTAGGEMVCTVRDMTTEYEQQRRLEEHEVTLRDTYEVISDRDRSLDEKVDALLGIGRDVIGTEYASLSRVDGDDYYFEVVQAPDESVQTGDVVPVSATNCERAIDTEETLVLENVAEDAPDLADRPGNADWGIACYLGAPVFVEESVYGTLCFYDDSPREEPFTDWQVTLVDLLSRWISYELERENHERALEQYREYTDNILDAIDDVFYVLDDSGELRRWNESLTDVTGYSDEGIESMHALDFFAEPDREPIATAISEGFETGQTRVEAELRTETDDAIPYEFAAASLEDPDGDAVLAGIGRDITLRREHERALEESNERLEQFAYAASHDLQEPLRMVTSYLRLLEDRYDDALDEDGEEFLEFAVDGADRMREMIDGLLEYSRVETRGDPFEPVDLDGILDDVRADLRLAIEESDAEIESDRLPRVEGDASQLRQVFQNLLGNAITYAGDDPPRIDVSATRRGTEWEISVRDTGIGIDPADQDRVFTVFDRLHGREEYEGTGIGLALCERIVERHGGDIWVDSEPGEGSTFAFTLPATDGD